MFKRMGKAAGLLLILLAVVIPAGCEDTDVIAPSGSTITVVASPAAININQAAGQTRGDAAIVALLLSDAGIPQSGVPLFFQSSGGLLGSVDNQCVAGTCAATRQACAVDADCPTQPPSSVETDSNGRAQDILTLRLGEDPASVDVTVQSTVSSTTISVGTNVSAGPQAQITATPADGARTGVPIDFRATATSGISITCYEWTIASSLPFVADEVIYTTSPSISKRYGDPFTRAAEQDLTVRLRVSGLSGPCGASQTFSQFEDSISYRIRCDFTNPQVIAGSNVVRSLANEGQIDPVTGENTVTVSLAATAFDEEDSCLIFEWNCDTPNTPGMACMDPNPENCCGTGATVSCKYVTEGTFTPTVTVTNRCDRIAEDNLTVQINP